MTAKLLRKLYDCLSAEERFYLILAAGERGDEAERERLVRSGPQLTQAQPAHAPYAHALNEIAQRTYLELLEAAAEYRAAFALADRADDDEPAAEDGAGAAPEWQRTLDLALAAGFLLRVKADGWQHFCAELRVCPWVLWDGSPGLERLQRTLALAEQAAFKPAGFACWLERTQPDGIAAGSIVPWSAETVARTTAEAFRRQVRWWGG